MFFGSRSLSETAFPSYCGHPGGVELIRTFHQDSSKTPAFYGMNHACPKRLIAI